MTIRKSRFLAILAVYLPLLLIPAALQAQDAPRIQVFAGYSHLQFDSKTLGFANDSGLNGATGSVAYNFVPQFGLRGEIYGEYGSKLRVAGWQIGPQGLYQRWGVTMFGHLLFGKGQTRVTTPIETTEQSGRSFDVGGGFDFPVGSHFSIRVIQADYLKFKTFGADQTNIKLATGLVYRWGTVGKKAKAKVTQ
jgi:hypothetical protein